MASVRHVVVTSFCSVFCASRSTGGIESSYHGVYIKFDLI